MNRILCPLGKALCVILAAVIFLSASALPAEAACKKPLEGKYISVIGDSISTYAGYSDRYPITDEGVTNRYAEPYYGPVGGDFHNTELLVTDTWWHQAATELGAEILVSNASNSTGLLFAYSSDPDWNQYLQDFLVYKTRPYHLDANGIDPDVIAIYIGSNDVARCTAATFGSIDDVDFDTLITRTETGYSYQTPVTVAEAYAIMLHKISVTYPDAHIYCFTVVPHSGMNMTNIQKRLKATHTFNEMIRGVSAYFDAEVVELLDAFALDPDCDSVITESALQEFKSCFNGDPHPNAKGFDVISDCFVNAVLETYPVCTPETGDDFPLTACVSALCVSALGLVSVLCVSIRRRRTASATIK